MNYGKSKGIFDGLPILGEKSYLKDELSRIDESWAAARFDSLPHVVHILTSKDREGEFRFLKEQSDIIEEVVDEVVHAYHGGFNKAIQNYSQILGLFSESAESISSLKTDVGDAKELLGSHNKQLRQLWYRSLTLRHIISLLDQIEGVSKVPARIEKLITEKQLYAAVQLHVQSTLLLEREGLQVVGALQDVRSELGKLRGMLFYRVLEDLHKHLFNKGDYSFVGAHLAETDYDVPATTVSSLSTNGSLPISRRTRSSKLESVASGIGDGGSSFDGRDEESMSEVADSVASDGFISSSRLNNGDSNTRDAKACSRKTPIWLSQATPDEFIETIKRSDASVIVKYLQTLVECLHMLGKVAAAGVIICQRLRPTIHEIMTSKIKTFSAAQISRKPCVVQASTNGSSHLYLSQSLDAYQSAKRKPKNGGSFILSQLVVSPVSPDMTPMGTTQSTASQLLSSILDSIIEILENHIIVGELLDLKSAQRGANANTPNLANGDTGWNPDPEASYITGGFSVGFCLTVIQSECQQLICEILRATPETASADASVQTARLASKAPKKDKRDSSEGLSFAFRFTEVASPNQGASQGWKKGSNVQQEGYGTNIVLPEQGIYLAASIYRPVVQFTEKIASLLPEKYLRLGNDGLLAFVENFLKDHFLPAMFVDYRKSIQQAISNPAAFRPRAHTTSLYSPLVERGRPVLQGLLATDLLAKEVLAWAQAMPKYSSELVEYVRTFLERAYERCRTSFTEAVLERQSYMLIGRQDMERLMCPDPANASLTISSDLEGGSSDSETIELELELSELLLALRPIRQENLIRDDHKFILLASLSDSLEYVADSIGRLGDCIPGAQCHADENGVSHSIRQSAHCSSLVAKNLASLSAEYRKLAIDCLKVLRVEMQLETIFHIQEMTRREYLEDQDAEEPDDFIISLTAQIMRRDEEMGPFVADARRSYIFGGICGIAANTTIKALAEMKSINLLGVQQICRNTIAVEQALAAIPLMNCEAVQQRFDRARTYYELLNLPYEALLAFIRENVYLFTPSEYSSLLRVNVPGREVPPDYQDRLSEILNR